MQGLHARIARVRRDFLHKATSLISKNHAWVFVEDLQVRNMSKSAKGTKENPGKHIKAKAGLNRAILDQGWFEFRRQLAYKLEWLGGKLFAVSPQYTSQTCLKCGHVNKENRKTQAKFACVQCGFLEQFRFHFLDFYRAIALKDFYRAHALKSHAERSEAK